MSDYRRPGVYLEETLGTQPAQQGSAVAVGVFAGVTPKGPAFTATPIASWSDFVQKFGGFDPITVMDGSTASTITSYLPHAVFAYYQNGGRTAYIVRVLPAALANQGVAASVAVTDGATTPNTAFTATANGAGIWGNSATGGLDVSITLQTEGSDGVSDIFTVTVRLDGQIVETFPNLSMAGVDGTRPAVAAINDPLAGSRYITATPGTLGTDPAAQVWPLAGGTDPATPAASDLTGTAVINAMRSIESPLLVAFEPFRKADGTFVVPAPTSGITTALNDSRGDCFVVWDGHPLAMVSNGTYTADAIALAGTIGSVDSYSALYVPWITTPDPTHAGATIIVPPSGSVVGAMARIDATIGPWRAPAGLPAGLSTAVAPEVRFSDTDQGQLNFQNINVIRTVPGSGVCIMGGRTRKLYGPDRYVSARRVLIYIEDSLKLSTQWAVFENNDSRLWSSLRLTAENLLRPLWERGGLAGNTATQAYYVVCDETINTPQVIQAGEVRMEIGVAVQYPAEFVVIRISQFDSGAAALELTPTA